MCQRDDSGKPYGDAGWRFELSERIEVTNEPSARETLSPETVGRLAADWAAQLTFVHHKHLTRDLDTCGSTLRSFRVGYNPHRDCFTFPMQDAAGHVIGVHFRYPSGQRASLRGGRCGLFLSVDDEPRPQVCYVAEGVSDAMILHRQGLNVVGRSSCTGGAELLLELFSIRQPTRIVVVADNDDAGLRGAKRLHARLVEQGYAAQVVSPMLSKDAREVFAAGATPTSLVSAAHGHSNIYWTHHKELVHA